MHIPRVYVTLPLQVGEVMDLPKEAAHHVQTVLRRKLGAPLVLFNGQGGQFQAEIMSLERNRLSVRLITFEPLGAADTGKLALHLGQALLRGEKMDFVVQKATELGVTEITPLVTEYTSLSLDPERAQRKREHWQKIAIHAAEQCGRTLVPTVHDLVPLAEWLSQRRDAQGFILSPNADHSLRDQPFNSDRINLLIGPEGGLSIAEEKLAQQLGFAGLRLGPRILRTETAALAALCVLQFHAGEF